MTKHMDLREGFVGSEEVLKSELFQDAFKQEMGEKAGMSHAVRGTSLDVECVLFPRLFFGTVRFELGNQGIAGFKGLPQPDYVVRLPIIETVKRADIKDDLFLGDFIAVFIYNSDRINETKIIVYANLKIGQMAH